MKKAVLVILFLVLGLCLSVSAEDKHKNKDKNQGPQWVEKFADGLEEAKDRGVLIIVCFPQTG